MIKSLSRTVPEEALRAQFLDLTVVRSRIERISVDFSAFVPVTVRLLWPGCGIDRWAMVQTTGRIAKRVFDRTLVP